MGLDQFMYRADNDDIAERILMGEDTGAPSWYGRKINFLQNRISEIIEHEVNNITFYEISLDDVKQIIEDCQFIKEHPDSAEDMLPTVEGFFFGSTEYGDLYFEDIDYLLESLPVFIKGSDENTRYIYYSWY